MPYQSALELNLCWSSFDSEVRIRGRPNRLRTSESELQVTKPSAKEVQATANSAGVPVDADVATRIANSIGPAFEGFAAIAGTLPFDLEPSTFVGVQTRKTEG